jgi:hypothetical protein
MMKQEQKESKLEKSLKRVEEKLNRITLELGVGEWVLSPLITARVGLTEMSMREYRRKSVWAEGIHWQKNPKGRIVYNVQAVDLWMSTNV